MASWARDFTPSRPSSNASPTRSRAKFTNVKRVYFIAGNETVLAALRVALAELGVIRPKAPRKKAKGSVKPAAEKAKRERTTRRARA